MVSLSKFRIIFPFIIVGVLIGCGGGGGGSGSGNGGSSSSSSSSSSGGSPSGTEAGESYSSVIPLPHTYTQEEGNFSIDSQTQIYVGDTDPALVGVGQILADHINPATGYNTTVESSSTAPTDNFIYLHLSTDSGLGEEGYEMDITDDGVSIVAFEPTGLFRGMATLLQLFSPNIHSATEVTADSWSLLKGSIEDAPRYVYRGYMLDVARHFHTIDELKRMVDIMALYKLNTFHIHLSDDQGWRLEILSWPRLTSYGGTTEVGGGPGGFYTQAEFIELVEYADSKFITIIPEVDMPGHTNAALASYAELNCDNMAPDLYTGIAVGFSSLCVGKEETSQFLSDVISELAGMTTGEYIHIGGDEADATSNEDYIDFIDEARVVIENNGKKMMGWTSVGMATLTSDSRVQQWHPSDNENILLSANQGAQIVMSPADKIYLEKYNVNSELGLSWAGYNSVEDAYDWDPDTFIDGISHLIVGVEAPLWSETIEDQTDIDTMTFPRLLGLAEIGWTPQASRSWDAYRTRLGNQGERLDVLGVEFYRSALVDWQ